MIEAIASRSRPASLYQCQVEAFDFAQAKLSRDQYPNQLFFQ